MNAKNQIMAALHNLGLARSDVSQMREVLQGIEAEMKKELPVEKREALKSERASLLASLSATEHSIRREERLLSLLSPEEQKVLERMVIDPQPEAAFDLAEELYCGTTRIYSIRSRALAKLVRLRHGAGASA